MIKVLHYVSIMNRAGQETFLMNMYRKIDREKIQFGFLCTVDEEGDYDAEIKELGGEIYHFSLSAAGGAAGQIKNYKAVKHAFRKYTDEYDIIHIHNYHAFDMTLSAIAALRAGAKKVVVHSHNSSADYHMELHKVFRPIISHLPVTRLACTQDAGKWMYTTNDFQVISNGIDVEKFKYNSKIRDQVRTELGLKEKFVIGHVGRFETQKNHELIMKVFSQYAKEDEEAVLLLVGTGSLQDKMKATARSLKIEDRVIFLGVRSDINDLYQGMDLFFFPSLFEGLGIVAIEAQVAGLPCIFTKTLPKELDISDEIIRCNLNAGIEEWVAAIKKAKNLSKTSTRSDNIEKVRNAGFDAEYSMTCLTKVYLEKEQKK